MQDLDIELFLFYSFFFLFWLFCFGEGQTRHIVQLDHFVAIELLTGAFWGGRRKSTVSIVQQWWFYKPKKLPSIPLPSVFISWSLLLFLYHLHPCQSGLGVFSFSFLFFSTKPVSYQCISSWHALSPITSKKHLCCALPWHSTHCSSYGGAVLHHQSSSTLHLIIFHIISLTSFN